MPAKVGITCYLIEIKPLLEYGALIWDGLPAFLAVELENIQSRSLDIVGLPRDFLPSLDERRKTISARGFRRTNDNINHPSHTMIVKPTEHQYNLRTTNICRSIISGTQRHKKSFVPRPLL